MAQWHAAIARRTVRECGAGMELSRVPSGGYSARNTEKLVPSSTSSGCCSSRTRARAVSVSSGSVTGPSLASAKGTRSMATGCCGKAIFPVCLARCPCAGTIEASQRTVGFVRPPGACALWMAYRTQMAISLRRPCQSIMTSFVPCMMRHEPQASTSMTSTHHGDPLFAAVIGASAELNDLVDDVGVSRMFAHLRHEGPLECTDRLRTEGCKRRHWLGPQPSVPSLRGGC